MKLFLLELICIGAIACSTPKQNVTATSLQDERTAFFPKATDVVEDVPAREKVWVFLMAGQSNMAGRGQVAPQDTVPHKRMLSVDASGRLIYAKEPLHFYEPTLAGLDCGLSFGRALITQIPDSITLLILPAAVGGSSISQWLGDSIYRNVQLLSNFRSKVETGKRYGTIKGILWHQGESDANDNGIPLYAERLSHLIKTFRSIAGNESTPVLLGELGSFSNNPAQWKAINDAIHRYSATDRNTDVISTADLKDKGDKIHFNAAGQRIMGERFAQAYLKKFY